MENLNLKNVIFFKFGMHVQEGKDNIIQRKQGEFKKCNKAFWAYGGTTCKPNQVQTFLRENEKNGEDTYLLLIASEANDDEAPVEYTQYSIEENGSLIHVPEGVHITSKENSKYAYVIGEIIKCNMTINCNDYRIAVGPSFGKTVYINKPHQFNAGARFNQHTDEASDLLKISYYAKLKDAVYIYK